MTNGPDFGSASFYGAQPGDYGTIGPYGYGSHRGEYGLDTAHGIVGISQSLAYNTSQGLPSSTTRMAFRPSRRRRRGVLRGLAALVVRLALATILTTAVMLLMYPFVHATPLHHHPAAVLRH